MMLDFSITDCSVDAELNDRLREKEGDVVISRVANPCHLFEF